MTERREDEPRIEDATPEEVAWAIFAAARPPDPSLRRSAARGRGGAVLFDRTSVARRSPHW